VGSTRRTMLATAAADGHRGDCSNSAADRTGNSCHVVLQKGPVRIRYDEIGDGFPLLLIAGGGLSSTIAGLISSNAQAGSR
jgi:hypothetical protein